MAVKWDSEIVTGNSAGMQNPKSKDSAADMRLTNISRPDTSHMRPFKPSATSGRNYIVHWAHVPYIVCYLPILGVGMNAIPGGHFPLTSEVAHLMSRIPPPQCFNASVVKVELRDVHVYTCRYITYTCTCILYLTTCSLYLMHVHVHVYIIFTQPAHTCTYMYTTSVKITQLNAW